jgi:hypothetical protein
LKFYFLCDDFSFFLLWTDAGAGKFMGIYCEMHYTHDGIIFFFVVADVPTCGPILLNLFLSSLLIPVVPLPGHETAGEYIALLSI